MALIRSSQLSYSSANTGKNNELQRFLVEFRRVAQIAIDELWEQDYVPKYIKLIDYKHIETHLTATGLQIALNHVADLVRGTRKSAKKLKKNPSKPNTSSICPWLDVRFVRFDWSNDTSFDCFMLFRRFDKNRKGEFIRIPLKKTKHFNKLLLKGTLKNGCRLSKKGLTFVFEMEPQKPMGNETLGIDIGITDAWSDSHGNQISDFEHPDGWTLSKILDLISRKKKGSKAFKRAQDLRGNFVGWSINKLNLQNVGEIKIEGIKDLRKGKKTDRKRSHWPYPQILNRIEQKAEESGVRVSKVNPRNTSRTCSKCGVVDIENRKGKVFKCVACGHTDDADLNAAINIERAKPLASQRGASSPSYERNKSEILIS